MQQWSLISLRIHLFSWPVFIYTPSYLLRQRLFQIVHWQKLSTIFITSNNSLSCIEPTILWKCENISLSPITFTNCCIWCQILANSLQCTSRWSTFYFSMLHNLQIDTIWESHFLKFNFSIDVSVKYTPVEVKRFSLAEFAHVYHFEPFIRIYVFLRILDIQYWVGFSCNSELNMKMWYIFLADNSDKHFSMPPGILNFISIRFLGAQFWTLCTWCFSFSQLGKVDFVSFSYSNIKALLFINLLCMKVASREEL